jgi:hypothetical protein
MNSITASGESVRPSRVQQILADLVEVPGDNVALPDQLCAACAEALPVNGVGLAFMSAKDHGGAIAATDGPARELEGIQLDLGEGPCVEASRGGRPVLLPDLARTGHARWPGFTPAALDAGVAAIFAFPLQVGGIRLGVLDLYRDTVGDLDDDDLVVALAFADAATVLLLHLQGSTEAGSGLHPQLSDPIEDRPAVHQATGMISVQAEVGLSEALLLLRANAYAAGRPTLQAAQDVVGRRLRFAPEDDHHE